MSWLAVAATLALFTTTVGCGNGLGLATVEGHVKQGGKPLANHWVRFTPAEGGRPGNGRTDNDGHYELSYTLKDKGAKIGVNKVEVGSGGEVDGRGNQLSLPKQIFSGEKTVTDGANTIDIEVPPK
jgi:hypothetical protein